jgi:uncharacterized protein YjbI with pentapeptide repeats
MTREETWNKLVQLRGTERKMPPRRWADLMAEDFIEADLTGADFSGADLKLVNLSGANLTGANFSKAKLIQVRLSGAKLSKANLSKAYLSASNLMRADLVEANLTGATFFRTYLDKANLTGANLIGAHLVDCDFNGTNLVGAVLSGANLTGADLSGANLTGAYLVEASLAGADLRKADLTGADLSGANLFGAKFLDAKLGNSNLKNTNINNVNFNNADLSYAQITGAIIWGLSTTGWKIERIKAEYVYFTRDVKNKEKYKRTLKEGQFEALFKSLPTIELIFEGGLSLPELWTLNAIIEDIKKQNPEFGLKLTNTSVDEFQTTVNVKTVKDEFLEKAASLLQSTLKEAIKGVSLENLLPHFPNILPFPGMDFSILKPYAHQPFSINPNITINLIQGDGSIICSSPDAKIEYSNIFNTYQNNKVEIDRLFNELKDSLHDLSEAQRINIQKSTNQLIEVIRERKDISKAQEIWNEIKEGLKTGGAAAGIFSTIAKLLGI